MRYLLVIALTFLTVSLSAQDNLNYTNKYVNDFADVLTDQQELSLRKKMSDFEDKTSIEFTVVTVESLNGRDIEGFTNDLFNKWGVGDRERNDGLMLLIAPNDRKWRTEVGYGLEKWLTDGYTKVEAEHILPKHFKLNDYFGGIEPLVATFIERLGTQSWAERDQQAKDDAIAAEIQAEKDAERSARNWAIFLDVLMVIGLLLTISLIIVYSVRKRKRLKLEAEQLAEKISRTIQTNQKEVDLYKEKLDTVKSLDPDGDHSRFESTLKSMGFAIAGGIVTTLDGVKTTESELHEMSSSNILIMDQIIQDHKDFAIYKSFVDSKSFESLDTQLKRRVQTFVDRNNASEYTIPFSDNAIVDQMMNAKAHNSRMCRYMDVVNIGNLSSAYRKCKDAIDKANALISVFESTLDSYVSAKQNIHVQYPKIAGYVLEMNASLKYADVKTSTKSRAEDAATAISQYNPQYDMASVKNSSINLNRLIAEVESVRQRAQQDVTSAEEERRRIKREKQRREEEEERRRRAERRRRESSYSSSSSGGFGGGSGFGGGFSGGSSGGGGSSGTW